MNQSSHHRGILIFCLKFAVFAPVCMIIWWTVVPSYVWVLGQVCAAIIIHAAGIPIEAMKVTSEGVLNTKIILIFFSENHRQSIEIARFVNNLPPFVSLVLATPGLGFARRMKVLAIGIAMLFASHAVFLVPFYVFARRIENAPELPLAFGMFLLTLPFILWIALAYWDKVTAFFDDELPDGELPDDEGE